MSFYAPLQKRPDNQSESVLAIAAATQRAQAHALEIEAAARRRLADEYEAADALGVPADIAARQVSSQVRFDDPGCIRDYGALIRCLRRRMHELGMTCNDLAASSGLQEGYVGKLFGTPGRRSFKTLGPISLPLLLAALGVYIRLEPIDEGARATPFRVLSALDFMAERAEEAA